MIAFTEKLAAAGVDIKVYVEPGMVHVFPLLFAAITDEKMDLPPQLAFHHMKEFFEHVLGDENTGLIDQERRTKYFTAALESPEPSVPSQDQPTSEAEDTGLAPPQQVRV